MISSTNHHAISEAISQAIQETEKLETQWREEEIVRNHQKQMLTIDRHEWSTIGLTLTAILIGAGALFCAYEYKKASQNVIGEISKALKPATPISALRNRPHATTSTPNIRESALYLTGSATEV